MCSLVCMLGQGATKQLNNSLDNYPGANMGNMHSGYYHDEPHQHMHQYNYNHGQGIHANFSQQQMGFDNQGYNQGHNPNFEQDQGHHFGNPHYGGGHFEGSRNSGGYNVPQGLYQQGPNTRSFRQLRF